MTEQKIEAAEDELAELLRTNPRIAYVTVPRSTLQAAILALRSYEHGIVAPALAKEAADLLEHRRGAFVTASRQSMGGQARAAALTPTKRSAIARRAAEARWHGKPTPRPPKVTNDDVEVARTNLTLLVSIRRQFALVGCRKTAERIEHAISSAKGAIRNLENRVDRDRA